ncbi:NAD(+) diphosphatase [Labrenzia aggregata]|uniref:NAD(+) diphosphatase n=2 Tax=Roseibium aggregatum TaxID=187304 RepID=A0A926NVM5_9HYPH|nr:NAD(+) diphosphatase [Roseibium aggregatum]
MNFIDNRLDRLAVRRGDTNWIKDQLYRSDTEVVLSTANRLVLPVDNPSHIGLPLGRTVELGANLEEMIFLGLDNTRNRALFAATTPGSDEEMEAVEGVRVIDLRTLALEAEHSREDLSALSQARALIHWHRTHRFCSRCGQPTTLAEAGYRRDCPSCGGQHFPRTDPCVIMLITDGDRALLGRPPRLAEGMFTTLAGFMEPGETIEQAVRRETFEEAGIRVGDVRLISNQPWPFPANLMLGCHGDALSSEISIGDDELEACRWCDRAEVRQMVDGTHPLGHRIPPAISIAHELIVGWLGEAD